MFGIFTFSEQPFISEMRLKISVNSMLKAEESRLAPRIRVLRDLPVNHEGDFVAVSYTHLRAHET